MSFAALPPVPQSGLTEAEYRLLAAIHENINLLTGQSTSVSKAIISGQVTVAGAPAGSATPVAISGAAATDIAQIAATLQVLINDVQALRDTVNILVAQLRS